MNLERLSHHLIDALRVDGDVFILQLQHAGALQNLTKVSTARERVVCDDVSNSDQYAFAFVNSDKHTDELLEALWEKMSYGSTIFFSYYKDGAPMPRDKITKRFIDLHKDDITVARQMLIHGKREHNLIVKCFPQERKPPTQSDDGTVTIATVFKTGGDFDVSYVNHIANSVKKHTTVPYKFVVLTDCFEGYGTNVHHVVPFDHDFPKWWGKMELFAPGKFDTEKILYIDLDTLIVDNIDEILRYGGNFFGLRDFYAQYSLGSGFMCWRNHNARVFQLYEKFMEDPDSNMSNNRSGDQQFIWNILSGYIEYAQDLYPKTIVSYKKDCIDSNQCVRIPDNTKVICFHGPPRPKHVNSPIIKEHWMG